MQEKLAKARNQLQIYRQSLSAQHGEKLKLQTYAVVAIGFKRLVWEKLS